MLEIDDTHYFCNTFQMNDEEKVHRFSALAKLYAEIRFTRKSAFFNRVAAMRCDTTCTYLFILCEGAATILIPNSQYAGASRPRTPTQIGSYATSSSFGPLAATTLTTPARATVRARRAVAAIRDGACTRNFGAHCLTLG